MTYPARLLEPGEEVIADVRPHGWCLAPPFAAAVVVLAGAVAAMTTHTGLVGRSAKAVDAAIAVVLVWALGWLVTRYLRWAASGLVVTTERVVWRAGVVVRRETDVPLAMVRDVQVRQSLGQRMLRAGDVVVDSGSAQEVFRWVPRPGSLRRELWHQVDAGRRGGGIVSVADELGRLDHLRQRGVLSVDEFESQKARLLRR